MGYLLVIAGVMLIVALCAPTFVLALTGPAHTHDEGARRPGHPCPACDQGA